MEEDVIRSATAPQRKANERESGIVFGPGLDDSTPLFRYMGLSQFLAWVESGRTSITRLHAWEDTWEAPLGKLPIMDDDGKLEYPMYTASQDLFGQCWTELEESDAMWRIYSPNKEGLRLSTQAGRFRLMRAVKAGLLARVNYYDHLQQVFDGRMLTGLGVPSHLGEGLFKRKAFAHEEEVRLLTVNDERCVEGERTGSDRIAVPLEPREFLTGVTVDPRAAPWYADMIASYCSRADFRFAPTVSTLYGPDIFGATRMAISYRPVEPDE